MKRRRPKSGLMKRLRRVVRSSRLGRALEWLRGTFVGNAGRSVAWRLSGNRVQRITRFMPGDEVVLLIQGFMHTRGVLSVLERRLRRDGYAVLSLNLARFLGSYNTRPIEELGQLVASKVARLRSKFGLGRISIIGHSMGGLVSRYYIQVLGGQQHVRTLVTLGSPHHGTSTAWLVSVPPFSLFTGCGRQMLPGAPFIRQLSARPFPPEVKVVSVYSKADIACPYRFSVLEARAGERVRNLGVDGIGHTSLLTSDRVYRLIRKELEDASGDRCRTVAAL